MGLLAFAVSCTEQQSREEQDALTFLYENMPLPDSVDYSRDFWEQNVAVTLRARREMPWGEKVPDREWRHFVLPLRVNNEDLDSFRITMYEELRDRVKDKTMYGAVLEINHWCHEHVSYQPSDSRTSSPLMTMRSAIGRCGEESTFTVSALRAVGIPARQVYTPRWAHTDDNHAWVEAWVDGKWFFLGACEPEPVLDLGWFNDPAARGMLMHTKAFGAYDGPEEVMSRTACYTEINVTQNYTDVSTIKVTVQDRDGKAVEDAKVDFRLYNYAEFYPIATKQSDEKGQASLTCGLGDLVVWANKGSLFGFQKVSVGKDSFATIVLDKDSTYTASIDLDLVPPVEKNNKPDVAAESVKANRLRLAKEDSIRAAYMKQTFYQEGEENSHEKLARANWQTIVNYKNSPEAQNCPDDILSTLARKDFRDVTMEVLMDVAKNTLSTSHPFWRSYVLAPRIANERLTPYRAELGRHFSGITPQNLIKWVTDSIRIDETRNPQHLCMSPLGVMRHRTADAHSRDIFFVAAARSVGIMARIDEVTGKVQWADYDSQWHNVLFGATEDIAPAQGTLRLTYKDQAIKQNPSYYSHFALTRIDGGQPQLQEFPENATWESHFRDGAQVDAGQYLLTTGTRLANGGVMAHLEFFGVKTDETKTMPLHLRVDDNKIRVIGNFNCELGFTNVKGTHKPILQTTGRGYYMIALIRSNHEPSTHILHDMEAANIYLSQWPHCFLMLFPDADDFSHFNRKEFDELPSNVLFGTADPETVEAMHIEELTHGSTDLPIVMICDTFNRVVWFHQGYTIGLGDQMMEIIRRLMMGE